MTKVVGIFICEEMGELMSPKSAVLALAGQGLQGDRYQTGKGAYSKAKPPKVRHVSLISVEAIEEANLEFGTTFALKDTRRNIGISGISATSLNDLIGRTFTIGDVLLRGDNLCDPCDRPTRLSGKPNFKEAFAGRGGIRAEILASGLIMIGYELIYLPIV